MANREPDSPLKLVFIGVVMIIGSAAGLVGFGGDLPAEVSLDLAGEVQEGQVLSALVDTSVRSKNRPGHPTWITFSYQVDGAKREARSITWDPALTAAAVPGAQVPIEVSRRRPEWARVQGSTINENGYGPFAFLFIAIFGGWLIRSAFRKDPPGV